MADDGRVCQIRDVDIVGAPDQDHVSESHSRKQWDDAECHDLVLAEESFITNIAARQSDSYDDSGKYSAPPRIQESRIVGHAGSAQRGRVIVDIA